MFKFLKKIFSKIVNFFRDIPKKPERPQPTRNTEEKKQEQPKAETSAEVKPEPPVERDAANAVFETFTFEALVAHLTNLTDKEIVEEETISEETDVEETTDEASTETKPTTDEVVSDTTDTAEETRPKVTSNAKVAKPPRRDRNAARKRKKGY